MISGHCSAGIVLEQQNIKHNITSLHLAVRDLSCSEKDSSFLEAWTKTRKKLVK